MGFSHLLDNSLRQGKKYQENITPLVAFYHKNQICCLLPCLESIRLLAGFSKEKNHFRFHDVFNFLTDSTKGNC